MDTFIHEQMQIQVNFWDVLRGKQYELKSEMNVFEKKLESEVIKKTMVWPYIKDGTETNTEKGTKIKF